MFEGGCTSIGDIGIGDCLFLFLFSVMFGLCVVGGGVDGIATH